MPVFDIAKQGSGGKTWGCQKVSPLNLIFMKPGEIYRNPAAWLGSIQLGPMGLQATNSGLPGAWCYFHRVSDFQVTTRKRPGDDSAETGKGEYSVNR